MLRRPDMEPHRHLRSQRQVTHPYPVFDLHFEADSPMQIVMSPAESFTSDFRSYATRSLDLINSLTSLVNPSVHAHLVSEGIVTVLISVLTNEMAALQNAACSILANLLCFENYNQYVLNSFSRPVLGSAEGEGRIGSSSVRQQIQLCGGHRLLISLLTSPSASINVVQGHKDNRSNTNVQGVANQQAARALNMIFCPQSPVPSPVGVVCSRRSCICCQRTLVKQDTSVLPQDAKFSKTSGDDNNVNPLKPPTNGTDFQADYLEFMGSHFISSESSRPWVCRYYHKSGSLKEKIITYLRVLPDGHIVGRGEDGTGLFKLFGKAHREIVGYVWTFHKTYIGQEVPRAAGEFKFLLFFPYFLYLNS